MNLASLLKPGQAPAVRLGQTDLSYAELDDMSARVAALLRGRGVEPGDYVGVILGKVVELPGVYYGVLRAGAVVVAISLASSEQQIGRQLTETGARLVFAWHEHLDTVEAGARRAGADYIVVHPASFRALLDETGPGVNGAAEPEPDDLAVVLYEPGANGSANAVQLTHADVVDTQVDWPC